MHDSKIYFPLKNLLELARPVTDSGFMVWLDPGTASLSFAFSAFFEAPRTRWAAAASLFSSLCLLCSSFFLASLYSLSFLVSSASFILASFSAFSSSLALKRARFWSVVTSHFAAPIGPSTLFSARGILAMVLAARLLWNMFSSVPRTAILNPSQPR